MFLVEYVQPGRPCLDEDQVRSRMSNKLRSKVYLGVGVCVWGEIRVTSYRAFEHLATGDCLVWREVSMWLRICHRLLIDAIFLNA